MITKLDMDQPFSHQDKNHEQHGANTNNSFLLTVKLDNYFHPPCQHMHLADWEAKDSAVVVWTEQKQLTPL